MISNGISIKFSKTVQSSSSRVLKDSKLRDDSTLEEEEERDFVTSVDRKQIHGTKKTVKKTELVIPLITKNEWAQDMDRRAEVAAAAAAKAGGGTVAIPAAPKPQPPPLSLEDQAVQELLGHAVSSTQPPPEPDDIPLLLQNAVPSGFEEEDNMDVSLRPDTSSLEDYERVPIDEYGMAMLRGMGWNKKEGIGLRNKRHVEIVEPQLRPKGLGLGASVSSGAKKDVQNASGSGGGGKEEELVFKIGAGALIQKGAEKGMYGKIEGFDEDNSRVVLKLAISGKMAAVSKFHLVLVKDSEYKGKSKVLNYDQYSEYKEKQDAKEKERRSREDGPEDSRTDHNVLGGSGSSGSKRPKNRDHHDDKLSNSKYKSREQNGSSSKSSSSHSHSKSRAWVRPHLKVRFIDKKYKSGKHYEKKFIVEDVIAEDRFVLRSSSDDTFLEDITTAQVETVIPKLPGTSVCVLGGRQKGRIGELVERGKRERGGEKTAIIKIPDGGVVELCYDDICEFVGDPEDYF